MPSRRTPWANTLLIAGSIFIHEPLKSKLPQVAGYVTGVPAGTVSIGRYPCASRNFRRAVGFSLLATLDPPGGRGLRASADCRSDTENWRKAVTAALRETPLSANLVDGYSARHLTVLEGLEAVRKRPGMYIGSTDERGMQHCLWEIIDNAVDEALNASCTNIEVTLHPDHSAEVYDNGRGIPVDIEPKSGLNGVELIMTRLHAGGKFGGSSYTASGGLHG